jgi:putative transposase
VRLLGGPGQASDIGQAAALIEGFRPGHVLADKGYDADHFRAAIRQARAAPVIPFTKSRAAVSRHDKDLYKERNRVERFFNKLKQFRHICTRFDRSALNYLAMAKLASIRLWLRHYESAA